jgi:hypothetical protein
VTPPQARASFATLAQSSTDYPEARATSSSDRGPLRRNLPRTGAAEWCQPRTARPLRSPSVEKTRVTTKRPDLSPVFGPLSTEENESLISILGRAEQCLLAFHDSVAAEGGSWHCRGITLDTYPSGQASISGTWRARTGLPSGSNSRPRTSGTARRGSPVAHPGSCRMTPGTLLERCGSPPNRHGNTVAAGSPPRRCDDREAACDALRSACAGLREL